MQEIARYWDKQSAIWAEEKNDAWFLPVTRHWMDYFKTLLPLLTGSKALEVGTASGYFANILSVAGYAVTAVDISPDMIAAARKVSANMNTTVDYHVMDARQLSFRENGFDLIFTRLMTWTIPDVPGFYKECFRVLKPGGMLLNFDGDFGNYTFTQEGHEKYPADIMEQANIIKSKLDISKHKRPQKDLEILKEIGFVNVQAAANAEAAILKDPGVSGLFKIQACKPTS